jgi:OOP family OmpA-OmpF porin
MKKGVAIRVAGLTLALVFFMGVGLVSAAEYCPDNFIFLLDQSGSMYMHYGKPPAHVKMAPDRLKVAIAKRVLSGINDQVPANNYKGTNFTSALELLAPVQEISRPGLYDRAAMAKALKSIKDDQEIFGRETPLGPGIISMDPVLAKMSGNTAVILVSDGEANLGTDPETDARAIYSKYPNACIHIVSVADTQDKKGKLILNAIHQMKPCSVMAEATTLDTDRAALDKFVRDVFCTQKKEAPPKEEVLILRGIHFDFDKYNIKPEWRAVLDEGTQILAKRPNVKITIEGHCDGIGTIPYNQTLSERRARAVFDYFSAKGISSSRMDTVGYGKMKPKATNDTEDGRAINRRVELKVMP